jgi:riboflavin transporter FmnP
MRFFLIYTFIISGYFVFNRQEQTILVIYKLFVGCTCKLVVRIIFKYIHVVCFYWLMNKYS